MKRFITVLSVLVVSVFISFAQTFEIDRAETNEPDSPLVILFKPKARYPRSETGIVCLQGTVTLRVQFRFDGTIGKISTIKGLPYGATENAIEAAGQIQFLPETKDGYYITTSRPVSFTFNIY